MVRVISSKSVNMPQEKVFSAIKEIDKLPTLFPDKYKEFKIMEQSNNYILTEEIVAISGKVIKQRVKHILEPNRLLKSEVIEGDAKGTVLIVQLNAKPDLTTEIKIDADLKYGKIGAVFGMFAKRKIKNEIDKIIEQFADAK